MNKEQVLDELDKVIDILTDEQFDKVRSSIECVDDFIRSYDENDKEK